jgi:hypothetical protein
MIKIRFKWTSCGGVAVCQDIRNIATSLPSILRPTELLVYHVNKLFTFTTHKLRLIGAQFTKTTYKSNPTTSARAARLCKRLELISPNLVARERDLLASPQLYKHPHPQCFSTKIQQAYAPSPSLSATSHTNSLSSSTPP